MLKNIVIKYDIIEMMQFFWEAKKDKQKLPDSYFISVADKEDMEVLYEEDFTEDSVRKVMSAVMNNEPLNNATKKEARFWNYNMWMLEDLDIMRAMMQPMKQLNLDELLEEFSQDSKYEELEVIFLPGHVEREYFVDNTYYFNFFTMQPDPADPSQIKVDGQSLKGYILDQGRKILSE